ncbi:MAG: N-formylglutamate amidohydrolase [Clostridia bacterium]
MKYIFEDFNIEFRKNNIMLSAPHCYPQFRNGEIKKKETRTGILVKDLAKKLSLSCIYKTKFYNNDPNWDDNSTYREQLVDFISIHNIKLLIDVHSMRAERDVDICIGINDGKNILNRFDIADEIKYVFESYGFKKVYIDTPFKAAFPNVISCYISKMCQIPCFQIEINNKFLHKDYDTYNFDLAKNAFSEIIKKIDLMLL